MHNTVLSIKILFIHITDKKRYCSIGMNLFYFLIIYHCSLLLSYSSHLVSLLFLRPYLFTFFKFFHYWFLLFLYGIYNFISDSMLYLYLQCTLCYGLDSTIVCSKITLIMCSFLVQRNERINLKHSIVTMLNCIHAYHVSNNLNGVKPQSHGCHNHEIHQYKMSSFFF